MFILRAIFWLSIVLLFLPGDPKAGAESPGMSALDAVIAARAAVADLAGMCERQPDVCSNGGAALQSLSSKARYGASFLYKTFDGGSSDPIGAKIDTILSTDGATPTGTLTPDDAAPSWRAPAPLPRGHKA